MADKLDLGGAVRSRAGLTAAELCERYGDQVYLFASMVSRGQLEADDIAQDALIRAIRALPRFRPAGGGLEAWLWTIVVNVARNHRRVASRRLALWEKLRGQDDPAGSTSDEPMPTELTDEQLIVAIRELPARSRATIALRFGADLSFAEVGHQLGISEAAAKMAVHRGLRQLRARLEESKHDN